MKGLGRPLGRLSGFLLATVVFSMTSSYGSLLGDLDAPAQSCWQIVADNQLRGDGFYWLKTKAAQYMYRGIFRAYCDITTDGGGWTLIARITDDYSWICPEKNWRELHACLGSSAPREHQTSGTRFTVECSSIRTTCLSEKKAVFIFRQRSWHLSWRTTFAPFAFHSTKEPT